MRALSDYFECLTLREVWDNDEDALLRAGLTKDEVQLIREICDLDIANPAEALNFLNQRDELFCAIYGEEERIPYQLTKTALARSALIHYDEFGKQDSAESVSEGAGLMAYRLSKRTLKEPYAATVASLCYIGKKYTASTNEDGIICFPNYATVSAYFAAAWIRQNRFYQSHYAKSVVSAIYAHQFPLKDWAHLYDHGTGRPLSLRTDFCEEMLALFGRGSEASVKEAMNLIDDMASSAAHLDKVRYRDKRQIAKGYQIISKYSGWLW